MLDRFRYIYRKDYDVYTVWPLNEPLPPNTIVLPKDEYLLRQHKQK